MPFALDQVSFFENKNDPSVENNPTFDSMKALNMEKISEVKEKLVLAPIATHNPYQTQTRDRYGQFASINSSITAAERPITTNYTLELPVKDYNFDRLPVQVKQPIRGKSAIPGVIRSENTIYGQSSLPQVWVENMLVRKSMGYLLYNRIKSSTKIRAMTNKIRQDVLLKRKLMRQIQSSLGTKISDTQHTQGKTNNELHEQTTNHISKEHVFQSNVDKLLQVQ